MRRYVDDGLPNELLEERPGRYMHDDQDTEWARFVDAVLIGRSAHEDFLMPR